jgi:antitoxin component YwqK of YwqJK toxin-antitoxin module
MKRIFILLFFVFIGLISFTQEKGTLKDGYQVFKYPNGTISSEGLIKNGKPEGYWKSFYVTGVKKSEGRRTNYLLDSIWVFYDQSGDTTHFFCHTDN